jgi:hypothetical protein
VYARQTTFQAEIQQRPPFGARVTVNAIITGVFDLTGVDLYIPVGGRRRGVTKRLMPDTLRRVPNSPVPLYTAMIYDERFASLDPVELPGYAVFVVG